MFPRLFSRQSLRLPALVAAGALGLAAQSLSVWADPPESTVHHHATVIPVAAPAQTLLIQIQLAWYGDAQTCGLPLTVHSSGDRLVLRGTVPSQSTSSRAYHLAKAQTTSPIVNEIRVQSSSRPVVAKVAADQMLRHIVTALREVLADKADTVEISSRSGGEITVSGSANSWQEKLLVSQTLARVPGCTCVINQLSVKASPAVPAGTTVVAAPTESNVQGVVYSEGAAKSSKTPVQQGSLPSIFGDPTTPSAPPPSYPTSWKPAEKLPSQPKPVETSAAPLPVIPQPVQVPVAAPPVPVETPVVQPVIPAVVAQPVVVPPPPSRPRGTTTMKVRDLGWPRVEFVEATPPPSAGTVTPVKSTIAMPKADQPTEKMSSKDVTSQRKKPSLAPVTMMETPPVEPAPTRPVSSIATVPPPVPVSAIVETVPAPMQDPSMTVDPKEEEGRVMGFIRKMLPSRKPSTPTPAVKPVETQNMLPPLPVPPRPERTTPGKTVTAPMPEQPEPASARPTWTPAPRTSWLRRMVSSPATPMPETSTTPVKSPPTSEVESNKGAATQPQYSTGVIILSEEPSEPAPAQPPTSTPIQPGKLQEQVRAVCGKDARGVTIETSTRGSTLIKVRVATPELAKSLSEKILQQLPELLHNESIRLQMEIMP